MKNGKSVRKTLTLIIVLSFVFTVILSGCSKSETGKATDKPKGTAQASETVQPSETAAPATQAAPSEITIFTIDNSYIEKNFDQDLPVFKEIEKNLNLKLKWQLMPSAGFEDALKIKLSAAVDMPDIFATWEQNPEELGKNGAVVALSDYFDTSMKHVKTAIDSNPLLKSAVTSPDGKVYFLPSVNQPFKGAWLIRQDWLDKLKLQVPETTEDFYKVLKAFRTQDPNGNGKEDEVPLAQNYADYTWFYMMHAFGLNTAQPWDFLGKDKDGKFYNYLTRPEFKETMAFMSKLYKEKLLNQDILNVSAESYLKLITDNKVGVVFDGMSASFLDKIKAANPGVEPKWTVMLPPKGPRGDRGVRSYSSLDGLYFVSKNSKNIEASTKFIDYIFADPEGSALVNWGVKGLSYTEENGEKQSTDFVLKNPDGLTPNDALLSIGVYPTLPKIAEANAHPKIKELQNKDNPWISEGLKLYADANLPGEPEKRYRYTSEESGQIAEIHTQLDTYISETLAKVLVGNKPVDELDNFVKTLNEKGIDRMAQIYQKIEDRSK